MDAITSKEVTFGVDWRFANGYSEQMANRKIKTTGFGHALRVARVKAGLSQKDLGALVGASNPGYVSMWETGSWLPNEKWMPKILELFPDLATFKEAKAKTAAPAIAPVRRKAAAKTAPVAVPPKTSLDYTIALDALFDAAGSLRAAQARFSNAKADLDASYRKLCADLDAELSK